MLKTNKIVSLILAVVLVVSMCTVALTSTFALSEGETWVVAGSGGLCGDEWQMPPSDSNYMSYNPENGNYEITYTGIAAGNYEFKVVNGTNWGDPDYNLEGQANGGANGVVNVTEDGSTVLIGTDGTKAYVEVTAGAQPTEPAPTETEATEPAPTETEATEPAPTETEATEPAPTETEATEPQPEGLFVKADGVLYPVTKGEKYTYTFTLLPDEKVCSLDASVFYDTKGVKAVLPVDEYGDVDKTALFPVFGSATVYNAGLEGDLRFNYSSADGMRIKPSNNVIVTVDFEVTADAGVYEIWTDLRVLAVNTSANEMIKYRVDSKNLVDEAKINAAYTFEGDVVPTETETTPAPTETDATEPTPTETDATEPTPTSADPAGLFVKADGVLHRVIKGETYIYTFTLLPDEKICSLDASVFYDTKGVEAVLPVDEDGDVDKTALFPVFGNATVYNAGLEGDLRFNYSSADGMRFKPDNNVVVTVPFKVTADEGVYEIWTDFRILAVNTKNNEMIRYRVDGQNLVDASKINDQYFFDGKFAPTPTDPKPTETDAPTPTDPKPTETETQPQPTDPKPTVPTPTEPKEDFYVAAGSATLFGEPGWNPADRNNELLFNEEKGVYEKVYTDVAAGTYEFKVTTNGAWDIGDYNLEGDAKFGGANAVAEVLYDGATVTIGFDGTKALLTIEYPTQPTQPTEPKPTTPDPTQDDTTPTETTPADKKVYLTIDGSDPIEVISGEVYTYTYLLACDKKISSLDCTTFYDAAGIEFMPDVDEFGDYTTVEFPNFKAVSNFNLDGRVVYNFSDINGVRFPVADPMTEKNIVFQGKFKVTAEEGTYAIYTDLKVLGDNQNNKIIFDGVKVDETATVVEDSTLDGNFAPDPTKPSETTPEPTKPSETTPEPTKPSETTPDPTKPSETTPDPTEDDTTPTEDETKKPATPGQSATDDTKKPTNNAPVKTGSTTAAIAFITVLVMAAGVVMFSRKKISE